MDELIKKIVDFHNKRDWKQFHSPKNVAESIVLESAELLEIFQWVTSSDSYKVAKERKKEVSEEVADIFIYLLTFANDLGIDLVQAALNKLTINDKKYPVDKAKGNSKKYNEL